MKNNKEKGLAPLISIAVILSISLIIGVSLTALSMNGIISSRNKIKSIQSYYAAEAGIEDSLLRLANDEMDFTISNSLDVGSSSVDIDISGLIGGSQTVICQGDTDNRIRKISATRFITTEEISFYYGAQIDEGGIEMGNNSKIQGNVFSNGNIIGRGTITETAIVANDGNRIEDTIIEGDAHTYSCVDSDITGDLYYVSGGSYDTCTYNSLIEETESIENQELPISPEQIIEWKNEAEIGGTIVGDYTLDIGLTDSLGPVKITGNMTIKNNAVLTVSGVIYVEGDITLEEETITQLDSSYGSLSGIILNDGKAVVSNNASLLGSGDERSFLMILSTNNSLDPDAPAIDVYNNAQTAIFYAPNGLILLRSNVNVKEVTGYKIKLENDVIVSYDIGLENTNFTEGPGGSWRIKDWQETE